MTKAQKLAVEQSEKRQKINELLALDEKITDEQRGELDGLTKRMQEIEPELRAAIVADGEVETRAAAEFAETPEARELRDLETRANIGNIFAACIEHRATAGPEAELQQHRGIGHNQIPLALLRKPVEKRAFTPAPGETGQSQAPIVQPVFSEGDAAFLGVAMPSVPAGDAVYPVLTSRPAVGGPHKDSTPVGETTGAFSADALAPSRLQASFFYRRTDAARFAGMAEALRMALSMGLSEAMDKEVIDQIVTDVARTDAGAVTTFALYRSGLVYGRIDGRFASMESDIRALVGNATLTHMSGQYRSNNADDSAVDSLRRISGGLRVSPHIAAVAVSKQDAIVRRGMRADAVAPTWEGLTLIPDEITKAGTGEIVITAVLLAAFKVVRAAGFARIQTQHA